MPNTELKVILPINDSWNNQFLLRTNMTSNPIQV